ncbi:MAG: peptidase M23 [uncultured bacterium]|nr:MAG: peptidase M23 [uncultured bacterium]
MTETQPFTNRGRALLIIVALLLLQLSVPGTDSDTLSLSASFYSPEASTFNFWQPLKTLFAATADKTANLKVAMLPKLPTRTFKIVSVTSTKASSGKIWPVKGAISSAFGMRRHPVTRRRSFHNGIDIKARTGTNIICPADGIVVCAAHAGLIGRLVKVRTGDGKTLYFGHMSKIKCAKGQRVKRGTLLGTVGRSGRATGPHLHFSVLSGGRYINPMKYLAAR